MIHNVVLGSIFYKMAVVVILVVQKTLLLVGLMVNVSQLGSVLVFMILLNLTKHVLIPVFLPLLFNNLSTVQYNISTKYGEEFSVRSINNFINLLNVALFIILHANMIYYKGFKDVQLVLQTSLS